MFKVMFNSVTRAQNLIVPFNFPDIRLESQFFADPLYSALISSKYFQRLFSIPFMGGLSYINNYEINNSRGDHSIGVALLAYFFCQINNMPKRLEKLWVSSALLHDIHHLPFSHTMEIALKQMTSFSFAQENKKLIFNKNNNTKSIANILSSFDLKADSLLIFRARSKRALIFRSTHNIDTLEGILRAYKIFWPKDKAFDELPFLITKKMSHKCNVNDEKFIDLLDEFWVLKNKVYQEFIYKDMHILFERILGYYLFDLCQKNHILNRLTDYTDIDLFSEFPDLHGKIRKLWEFIRLICSHENKNNAELLKDVLTCLPETPPQSFSGNLIRYRIGFRQFLINRKRIIENLNLSSLKRRYKIKRSYLILLINPTFLKNIEDLLDYPLLSLRFQHIGFT